MDDKIKKLPKWAQTHIANLERERDVAVRSLNETIDDQTESPFFWDDLVCTGETQGPSLKRRYFQSHAIRVVHEGVSLSIYLRDGEIDLSWGDTGNHGREVALIPSLYQQARLVSQENMRK